LYLWRANAPSDTENGGKYPASDSQKKKTKKNLKNPRRTKVYICFGIACHRLAGDSEKRALVEIVIEVFL
jgi:hypothetical protein